MMNITSTEFKKQLGTYLASTHEGPIQIEKAGQPVAVVLSPSEYAYLHELEEKYWVARADAAVSTGDWIEYDDAVQRIAGGLSGPSEADRNP